MTLVLKLSQESHSRNKVNSLNMMEIVCESLSSIDSHLHTTNAQSVKSNDEKTRLFFETIEISSWNYIQSLTQPDPHS
jgi:hypothetical protein